MSYTRRSARWALVVVATWLITACGGAPAAAPTAAPAATEAPTAPSVIDAATATPAPVEATATAAPAPAVATLNGITLPADAAPADQQVYRTFFNATTTFTTAARSGVLTADSSATAGGENVVIEASSVRSVFIGKH